MSQVDNRNSSAAKRARTDGGRREDDWTCPSCGNVNFSFRTTCNMRNCTQPRPADHNFKSAPKPVQAPQGYLSAAPYVGSGAPSSMYMGVPPYGSSVLNGTSMPPYDVPFSGGMYGVPPMMDQYGLGFPMSPAMGPGPGFFPEGKSQNKSGDGARDNDWACPKCGNLNFSFRTVCNMRKCNTPKPGSQGGKSGKNPKPDMPEGSWKCEKCNNINYPFRTKCNRQNCGADKPSEPKKSPPEAADANDQPRPHVNIVGAINFVLAVLGSGPAVKKLAQVEGVAQNELCAGGYSNDAFVLDTILENATQIQVFGGKAFYSQLVRDVTGKYIRHSWNSVKQPDLRLRILS
ncbi:RanBP2-type zinc finger protein [Sesamum angolense]|uniref:RanBP2-type zinc finger protein n=1 Tax=Sesamum angolense TaxID=2727404 RepID=A0AAE2BVQ3_9LAMI|nr:RanBP2-type zinc finger protein [Sesamum angolense]